MTLPICVPDAHPIFLSDTYPFVTVFPSSWNDCDKRRGTSVTTAVVTLIDGEKWSLVVYDHHLVTINVFVVNVIRVIAIACEQFGYKFLLFLRNEFLASQAAIETGTSTECRWFLFYGWFFILPMAFHSADSFSFLRTTIPAFSFAAVVRGGSAQ